MVRMISNVESTTSEVLRELDVARWHALEEMILEERAHRSKEFAEIREVLAMVSAQPNVQQLSKGLSTNEPELCLGTTRNEEIEGKPSTFQIDMQSFNKLIRDMQESFTSRLLECEAKFQAQADRHVALFEHHLKSTERLKETMKEAEQADLAEKRVEDANSVTSMSGSRCSLILHASGFSKVLASRSAHNTRTPRCSVREPPAPQSRTMFSEPAHTPDCVQVCRGAVIAIAASPPPSARSVVQNYQHHAQTRSPSLNARQVYFLQVAPVKPSDTPRGSSIP